MKSVALIYKSADIFFGKKLNNYPKARRSLGEICFFFLREQVIGSVTMWNGVFTGESFDVSRRNYNKYPTRQAEPERVLCSADRVFRGRGGGASRLYPISLTGTIYVISRRNYNKFPTPRGSPSSPPPLIFKPPTPLLYSISALLIFGEPIWFLRLAELGGWGVGGSVGKSFFGACQLFFLLGQGGGHRKKNTHPPSQTEFFLPLNYPPPLKWVYNYI